MQEIGDLPQHLRNIAKKLAGRGFGGSIPPGHENIRGTSEGIPLKEVMVHNNVAVLNPGEAALSGEFALCSAVIAKIGDKLFVMHIYPYEKTAVEYIESIIKQGIINPKNDILFDKVLLIGRVAAKHIDNFAKVSRGRPQTISLGRETEEEYFDQEKEKLFNILVYNNPNSPGEVSSFDLWFDEPKPDKWLSVVRQ